ncbi:hypothetical protein NE237_004611 [Protea cynaroides]|uniref:Uncharacterized protein n=1 Tax=Protea cynaroides TaxID=273540 RepID=A0A9Q0KJ36_9MAGN|nr:hypothetical protein NE237_004611 [Protea cynaroides]
MADDFDFGDKVPPSFDRMGKAMKDTEAKGFNPEDCSTKEKEARLQEEDEERETEARNIETKFEIFGLITFLAQNLNTLEPFMVSRGMGSKLQPPRYLRQVLTGHEVVIEDKSF